MPLDATIGPEFSQYCTGGRHGYQFWLQKSGSGVVKSLFGS
jgi:hypothetical protein